MLSQSPIGRDDSTSARSLVSASTSTTFSAVSFDSPASLASASMPCLSTSNINASTIPSNLVTSSRNRAFSLLKPSFCASASPRALRSSAGPICSGSLRRVGTSPSSAAASRRSVNARSEEMSATVRSHARSVRRRRDDPATDARRQPDDDASDVLVGTLGLPSSVWRSSTGIGAPVRRSLARRIASSARRSFARRYASSCGR